MAFILKRNVLNIKNPNTGLFENVPMMAGESAYQIAVRHGFEGTEEDWINHLSGTSGGIVTEALKAKKAGALDLSAAVGSASEPVYFDANGLPVKCGTKLGSAAAYNVSDDPNTTTNSVMTNIAVKAAMQSASAKATKAGSLDLSAGVGSATTPVYFNASGLPVACGKVASASVADSANAVAWANVTGKPSTFTPATHTHSASQVGLGNVGNFKAVSTVANQGLTDQEKANARSNIGAGASSFSGSYNDLTNKPTIPSVGNGTVTITQNGASKGSFTMNQGGNTTIALTDTNTNTWTALKGATTDAAGVAGYAPAPSAGAANRYLRSDGTWSVPPDNNTTYGTMKGATTSAAGSAGLVPAPAAGAANRYFRSDGTWQVPPDTNTTYADATTSAHGLMTAAMVSKLNGIAAGANAYSHPSYTARNSGFYKVTVDGAGHVSNVAAVTKADITALGIPGSDTNTTYSVGTASYSGTTKLYTGTGTATDGTMTQKAITDQLAAQNKNSISSISGGNQNGIVKFGNGLKMQWNVAILKYANANVVNNGIVFTESFTNCPLVIASVFDSTNANGFLTGNVKVYNIQPNQFTAAIHVNGNFFNSSSTKQIIWLAIGV